MLKYFNQLWNAVPSVFVDTETTGIRPGQDRVVQVGVVRFEGGKLVGATESLINPGRPIPAEATAIHGITDEMVRSAPSLGEWFAEPSTQQLLDGAQPGAFNAGFDRGFLPQDAIPHIEHSWPWIDALSIVRAVDKWQRGAGRHKLTAVCARHGVALTQAHSAGADARAAGELFYRLVPKLAGCQEAQRLPPASELTLGQLLCWQRIQESRSWFEFCTWLVKQPPRDEVRP